MCNAKPCSSLRMSRWSGSAMTTTTRRPRTVTGPGPLRIRRRPISDKLVMTPARRPRVGGYRPVPSIVCVCVCVCVCEYFILFDLNYLDI